ncbi:MAG: lipid-binding SYLF domain-containing protein [Bdellovibrionales bacterium]|nr:lipid-binding SYLF domain-containing protein [Bdellovibrionales bacterium]
MIKVMNFRNAITSLAVMGLFLPTVSSAQSQPSETLPAMQEKLQGQARSQHAEHPSMKLHQGSGPVQADEYVIVDLTGSVTRSPCPYTCQDRGLAQANCRAWPSKQDPKECYVQDTRIPSDAFYEGKGGSTSAGSPAASGSTSHQAGRMTQSTSDTRARMGQQDRQASTEVQQNTENVVYERTVALSEGELSQLVKDASSTLRALTQGQNPPLSRSTLQGAECLAVFPSVTTVAAVVGGSHGDGIVTCKGPNNSWSSLGFLDLFSASLGAQLGAKSTGMVLLFTNQKARQQLETGKLTVGADVTASFGGAATDELRRDREIPDVQVYSKSTGLFAGVNLNGTVLTADEDELRSFYEENAAYQRVLTTYDAPNHPVVVRDFIQLMSEEQLDQIGNDAG